MLGELCATRCSSCGKVTYPSHHRCPECGGGQLELTQIPTKGTLLTYTRVYALAIDYVQRYLTLGIAELEGGLRVTGHLLDDNPRTGMPVRLQVGKVREMEGEDVLGFQLIRAEQ